MGGLRADYGMQVRVCGCGGPQVINCFAEDRAVDECGGDGRCGEPEDAIWRLSVA